MKIRRRRALAIAAACVAAPPFALCVTAAFTSLPAELSSPAPASVRAVDRTGRLLREVRANDGKRARPLAIDEMGQAIERAMIAAEDRRFHDHHGVDVRALARAFAQNLWHRRVVSGGSTLTMQLARTLRPRPRTLAGKWREAALALRIEWSLPKRRILEEYLNRVDFGPNLRGVGAASQAYFDKPPRSLSLAEAALLAGLPRGPSLYALTKRPELAKRRRDRVLSRLAAAGLAREEEIAAARAEPVIAQREGAAFGAPHLVQGLLDGSLAKAQPGLAEVMARGPVDRIETTLDGSLQRAAESATLTAIHALSGRHVSAGAAVVIDNATGDVLAYVGSPDFFAEAQLGQNDGARALRQPGSALKPFLYALAMERLGFTAATSLPDVELHVPIEGGADFAPRNYDDKRRGPVRLRQALGNSLNIPAVWTIEQLGVEAFLQRLREHHFDDLREGPSYYGPALALGDGEVTLLQLARAYASLARGGVDLPPRFVRAVVRAGDAGEELPRGEETRVLPAPIAAAITDILKDPRARAASFDEAEALRFPFDVAAKTGTSKGFRDNWAAGYTSEVTVAAWAGNFDGSPMDQVSGIAGAGPIFHAVMEVAMEKRAPRPLPIEPDSQGFSRVAVCPLSGGAPTPACGAHVLEWIPAAAARDLPSCDKHEDVAIDRRNGLRAGRSCPASFVEHRVYERYSPDLLAWARATNRPVAPDEFSPLCPADDGDLPAIEGALRITYPHDGATFLLDPERPRELQALRVLVSAPSGAREITLRIDDKPMKLSPPFAATWRLEPGDHHFLAEARGAAPSPRVRVTVR